MEFNPGLDIKFDEKEFKFIYGKDVFGPEPEIRYLDDIRKSLKDPNVTGPDKLYSISMDIGKKKDKEKLESLDLLFAAVLYSKGMIGNEPVRSQGHIHAISKSCNSSTCEVYEIWEGEAIIYIQESGSDDAGECYAVHAKPGDVVIVPPGAVHATVNENPTKNMVFGAFCVRDYGFLYNDVRRHHGIAFFPIINEDGKIKWEFNKNYKSAKLHEVNARTYEEFGIKSNECVYAQYEKNPEMFLFVSKPNNFKKLWDDYKVEG